MDYKRITTTGVNAMQSDIRNRLYGAYDAVCNAEESLINIEKEIESIIPKKIDLCSCHQVIDRFDNVSSRLVDIQNTMTTGVNSALSSLTQAASIEETMKSVVQSEVSKDISAVESKVEDAIVKGNEIIQDVSQIALLVNPDYIKYQATQIILKKFQLIQYRLEAISVNISSRIAELTKLSLSEIIKGKGSTQNPITRPLTQAMQQTAKITNTVMNVVNTIMSIISGMTILNINGAGMAFFQTPKSLVKKDIQVVNTKMSITANIPDPVELTITEAEQAQNKIKGDEKLKQVVAMGANGMATALSDNFNPGEFGTLTKFNPQAVRVAVQAILQTLTDAEGLPRYEKLSISNIRFLFFLATGFEPAGKMTFGIPGFP